MRWIHKGKHTLDLFAGAHGGRSSLCHSSKALPQRGLLGSCLARGHERVGPGPGGVTWWLAPRKAHMVDIYALQACASNLLYTWEFVPFKVITNGIKM